MKAFSHITGGGLSENIPRVLPENVKVELDASQWTVPAVFGWLSQSGNIDEQEMSRTFNCGIGAVLIVKAENANEIQSLIEVNSETVWRIGSVKSCSKNGNETLLSNVKFEQRLEDLIVYLIVYCSTCVTSNTVSNCIIEMSVLSILSIQAFLVYFLFIF